MIRKLLILNKIRPVYKPDFGTPRISVGYLGRQICTVGTRAKVHVLTYIHMLHSSDRTLNVLDFNIFFVFFKDIVQRNHGGSKVLLQNG